MSLKRSTEIVQKAMRKLRMRIAATKLVIVLERFVYAFWAAIALCLVLLGVYRWGLLGVLPTNLSMSIVGATLLGILYLTYLGFRKFRMPERRDVLARIDVDLTGMPITSLNDELSMGQGDATSEMLWELHMKRMADRADRAEVPKPMVRLATQDRWGLRLVALLVLLTAVIFGRGEISNNFVENVGVDGEVIATGPSFELWAKPPLYTKLPTIYLNDVDPDADLKLAQGSQILVRAYGSSGSIQLDENVSPTGQAELPVVESELSEVEFSLTQSGRIRVSSDAGAQRVWDVTIIPDQVPEIEITGEMSRSLKGAMQLPFRVTDDYGVTGGQLFIELDLDAVDRRYGLALDPEPIAPYEGALPLPFTGDTSDFEGTLEEDVAKHILAGLPVTLNLTATDAAGNQGALEPFKTELARKRFFDPLAAALIDVRRQMMWNRQNAQRASYLLRAISTKPEGLFSQEKAYLMTRTAIRRMEYNTDALSDELVKEVSELLWEAALLIEHGDLNDAKERMKRAQDRLNEAMENGATKEEIAELMQELREATRAYMRQLPVEEGDETQQSSNDSSNSISQDELQAMMDRIQELMEQGRMDEAQELLRQLQEMMENMRVVSQDGQGGEGGESQDNMQDTLREQQDLADDTFRQLQEQFNQRQQGQQPGQQQGQDGQQPGQQGEQQGQQGQQPGGQPSEEGQQQGQQGQQQGQNGQQGNNGQGDGQGQQGQNGQGGTAQSDLEGRQRALRNMLSQQQGSLPNDGSEAGEAAREEMENAERQMGNAEDSLNEGDLGGALNEQAQALDSLRRGMRALGEQSRQAQNQQGQQQGQEGSGQGTASRDPLGRQSGDVPGSSLSDGAEKNRGLDGDAIGRRKQYQDLLDDLRERSEDQTRPEFELDYLNRLLDRF